MKRFLTFIAFFSLIACQSYEEQTADGQASFLIGYMPQFGNVEINARQLRISAWEHQMAASMEVHIQSTADGSSHVLNFTLSNSNLPQTILLPYGTYTYEVTLDGREMEQYLPFRSEGTFELQGPQAQISMQAESSYGLITVLNDQVDGVSSEGQEFYLTDDEEFYYLYVAGGSAVSLTVNPKDGQDPINRELTVGTSEHYHFFINPSGEPNSSLVDLVMGEFSYTEEEIALDNLTNVVYDADGNRYRTVQVGNQVWMAENLRTSSYCNGDPIRREANPENWDDVEEGLWTYYDDNEAYGPIYGKLYNGYAATDERNICPCDWRVPTKEDFEELAQLLDQDYTGPDRMKDTGFEHWKSPNTGATNETGMTMRGGGMLLRQTPQRDREENRWHYPFPLRVGYNWLHLVGSWWTQTEGEFRFWWYASQPEPPGYRFNTLYVMDLRFNSVGYVNPGVHDGYKTEGMSIRCINENP
ncbi:fibrobacter succinogenes major paralogous domain-containing protein [Litoribacter alkaliphilus]|uniref:Fibrobacter succinogenes major paralogous domain-containing protein n=1 Tax=Litoribacter ruber TaxID=702568 RepID=A0AAP2G3Z7_9BACT|nr:fibrobacter succinogenes major paralogous domain-containing protein [Litoribacter alkaliphilus]MBS9524000.1 fibrobacter succinogenes major paralogous domain-containing protein [Litoribacter alkaliphilus]